MKEAERVADEIIEKYSPYCEGNDYDSGAERKENAKQCALICVENEYHSLREMLFSLRSSKVIKSERVYLSRLEKLIQLEQEVKTIIENK
tara:strand:+ start:761 stop:1030 length:270 start_codon:yes stop_codon:yes gene_type:complete